ncbi:hypothetical protein GCM10012278_11180 [Nonomuraea glycinis]|uniref:Uncharacterized protein n=1 Tax=Nonomuraea glycinis TaxID=2047744 RepID=A0A918A098_9ACTN|nr:hypothetical protein GCM10012278_11180 [Nonomuraea glycinis]
MRVCGVYGLVPTVVQSGMTKVYDHMNRLAACTPRAYSTTRPSAVRVVRRNSITGSPVGRSSPCLCGCTGRRTLYGETAVQLRRELELAVKQLERAGGDASGGAPGEAP